MLNTNFFTELDELKNKLENKEKELYDTVVEIDKNINFLSTWNNYQDGKYDYYDKIWWHTVIRDNIRMVEVYFEYYAHGENQQDRVEVPYEYLFMNSIDYIAIEQEKKEKEKQQLALQTRNEKQRKEADKKKRDYELYLELKAEFEK